MSKETICLRELSSLILKENCGKERNMVTESKQIKVLFLFPKGYLKDNIQHRADFIGLTLLQVAPLQSTITERSSKMNAANTDQAKSATEGNTPSALGKKCFVLSFKFTDI